MGKIQIPIQSNLSMDLLSIRAADKGLSLSEIVEKEGLPINPTFELLFKIIASKTALKELKARALELAKELSKNNEEYRKKLSATSRPSKSAQEKQSISHETIETPGGDTSEGRFEKQKKNRNDLDQLVDRILKDTEKNLVTITSLYLTMPNKHERLLLVEEEIKKLINNCLSKGEREKVQLVCKNEKIKNLMGADLEALLT